MQSRTVREPKGHFYYLDWLRGLAAFFVFVYHARNLLFLDAGENPRALSVAGKFFYFLTGFGHLSVIVFFVLSGCVIAQTVIPTIERGSWSWMTYLVARLTRLWVVLVPGVILTFVWDSLAWEYFPSALPHSSLNYAHMLAPSDHDALGGRILMGNIAFLQTILVPCYGSNGALWSLANEFWYYLIFPFLAMCCWGVCSTVARIVGLIFAMALLWGSGAGIAMLFPVWLLGGVIYVLWHNGLVPRSGIARWGFWPALGVAVGTLSYIRAHAAQGGHASDDFTAGAVVAVLCFFLLFRRPDVDGPVHKLMKGASEMSFTLYIVHTPVLVFIASWIMNRRTERWPFDLYHLGCFILILVAVLAYAYLIYRISEAHTSKVRRWIMRRLPVEAQGDSRFPYGANGGDGSNVERSRESGSNGSRGPGSFA